MESLSQHSRLRFSLKHLLTAMTVVAFACGFAVLVPVAISHLLIGLFWMAALGVLAVGVLFGHGDRRAFCIGALIVTSSVWTDIGGRYMQGVHYLYDLLVPGNSITLALLLWVDLLVLAATAIANGWVCVQARRYLERP